YARTMHAVQARVRFSGPKRRDRRFQSHDFAIFFISCKPLTTGSLRLILQIAITGSVEDGRLGCARRNRNLRLYLAAGWLAAAAYAGPPLTTIQDVLYKADGSRFNGILTIGWNSFQASDNSTIVTQSATVKVVDGNLRVQLVPSATATPAGVYS